MDSLWEGPVAATKQDPAFRPDNLGHLIKESHKMIRRKPASGCFSLEMELLRH